MMNLLKQPIDVVFRAEIISKIPNTTVKHTTEYECIGTCKSFAGDRCDIIIFAISIVDNRSIPEKRRKLSGNEYYDTKDALMKLWDEGKWTEISKCPIRQNVLSAVSTELNKISSNLR